MDNIQPTSSRGAGRLWLVRALALAGLGMSVFLLISSLSESGRPVGCGAGSGCGAVLGSRWSSVLGMPVSLLAAGAYAALLGLTWPAASRSPARRRTAAIVAVFVAITIFGAAAWFIVLQLAVLKAVCPYCMVDHGIGIVAAALVLTGALGAVRPVLGRAAAAGLAGVAALITLQVSLPGPSTLQRLPATGNFDTGPGAERMVGLIDGTLRLDAMQEPVLGSPGAKNVLACLFDYACPHCRRTHEYLRAAVARWPGDLAVVALPCPLSASCNPHIPETEPRFKGSCELAELALGVWKADPAKFREFDLWLFEPEMPRTAAAAREEAARLVGAPALEAALASGWPKVAIGRNVEGFGRSGTDRLPILLSPTIGGVAGRPESEGELMGILEEELGLPKVGLPGR